MSGKEKNELREKNQTGQPSDPLNPSNRYLLEPRRLPDLSAFWFGNHTAQVINVSMQKPKFEEDAWP